jgi:hypothetical protein
VTFDAPAGVPHTLWLRLRAQNNSKFNDAVWVQYSDARSGSSSVYPIGSTSGLLVNLATDATATSLNGWGWQNTAYWLSQATTVTFASSGTHVMRVQVREDGVELDQIVLSSTTYLNAAPGAVSADGNIVPKPGPSYTLVDVGNEKRLCFNPCGNKTVNGGGAIVYWNGGGDEPYTSYATAAGVVDLGSFVGGAQTVGLAVNSNGVIVGYAGVALRSDGSNINHGFMWTQSTGLRDITPNAGTAGSGSCFDVNNRGEALCTTQDGTSVYTNGQLYVVKPRIVNLNGWFLDSVVGLADDGTIVATAHPTNGSGTRPVLLVRNR